MLRVEDLRLRCGQKRSAQPNALRAERQSGGDATTCRDTASSHDWQWFDGLNDLRDQRHRGDASGVASCLRSLGHDDIYACLDLPRGVANVANQPHHLGSCVSRIGDQPRRVAERSGEHRDFLFKNDLNLLAGQSDPSAS